MQKESLTALVRHHLETASTASSGRSAHTIYGGHEHVLRQTLIALRAGSSLDEHENPGEATVQVLHGRVTLVAGENRWNGSPGDLMFVPDSRHSLEAVEDSVVLLTWPRSADHNAPSTTFDSASCMLSADFTVVPHGTVIASLLMASRTSIRGSLRRRWPHTVRRERPRQGPRSRPHRR